MNVVRAPDDYEARLRTYYYAAGEEARAVRVGEKEVSEQAAIIARYSDLFSHGQLEALRTAEEAAADAEGGERLYRLRKTCESGLVTSELAPLQDALQNAELAARVEFQGESIPLRSAKARVGILPSYADREQLGKAAWDVSAGFNDQRLELLTAWEELRAELTGERDPVARSDGEKGISLRGLADALADASRALAEHYHEMRRIWLDRLLGPDREALPTSYHAAYANGLSALADLYSKERATAVCLETLEAIGLNLAEYPSIRTDLEDRPQKAPRPSMIASDPPEVVHLITRPQGGLRDYQAFLHEAGHAFHYAGCDPRLPYAFRALSRDNALTEVYSFLCESISREPSWHAQHFGLSDEQAAEHAQAARFLHAFLVRRYVAKLDFELKFWSRFVIDGGSPDGYAERVTDATGFVYRPDAYLSDMDSGFYSADYLRAWVRSSQLRSHLIEELGEDWWRRAETGRLLLELFREGTRPSNEEIAERIGFGPFDVQPLVAELAGTREVRPA